MDENIDIAKGLLDSALNNYFFADNIPDEAFRNVSMAIENIKNILTKESNDILRLYVRDNHLNNMIIKLEMNTTTMLSSIYYYICIYVYNFSVSDANQLKFNIINKLYDDDQLIAYLCNMIHKTIKLIELPYSLRNDLKLDIIFKEIHPLIFIHDIPNGIKYSCDVPIILRVFERLFGPNSYCEPLDYQVKAIQQLNYWCSIHNLKFSSCVIQDCTECTLLTKKCTNISIINAFICTIINGESYKSFEQFFDACVIALNYQLPYHEYCEIEVTLNNIYDIIIKTANECNIMYHDQYAQKITDLKNHIYIKKTIPLPVTEEILYNIKDQLLFQKI